MSPFSASGPAGPSPLSAPRPFTLEGIHFTHRGKKKPLFTGLDFCLQAGERVGILGKNGCGKSTLLHMGAGLLSPDAGAVRHQGVLCREEKDFVEARKKLGYLLQRAEDQLFCSTVLEDVAFGPYNLGHTAAEAEKMALNTLRELKLDHLAQRNGQRLSGGEQKLAALATILVMNVEVLFLDEPTNNLDEDARVLLLAVLENCRLPALIVSHDMPFLRALCTRFCLLENGRMQEVDLQGNGIAYAV